MTLTRNKTAYKR